MNACPACEKAGGHLPGCYRELSPVPTWYQLLARELVAAGEELAARLEDDVPAGTFERWDRAVAALGGES